MLLTVLSVPLVGRRGYCACAFRRDKLAHRSDLTPRGVEGEARGEAVDERGRIAFPGGLFYAALSYAFRHALPLPRTRAVPRRALP